MYLHMGERLPALKCDPDEWVRRMMRWHFDERSGSPFWLARKPHLDFDPIADVTGLGDLSRFGNFDKAVLRSVRLQDLVPRGLAARPRRVFETGGTSGDPCRIVDITTGAANLILYQTMLEARGLAQLDMVAMTPTGPHAYGTFVARLADSWRRNAYFVDFDPRWVKALIRAGENTRPYIDHLVGQTVVLLASQQPGLLFSTSKLLVELAIRLPRPIREYGVLAVCTGGNSLGEEEAALLREGFLDGVTWIDTYGNTLMGHALQADALDGEPASYHLPPPLGFVHVVEAENPERQVAVGERGQVRIAMLAEDLFIPGLLERDSAERAPPHPWFPLDGVRRIGPHSSSASTTTEGVY
jgi:hypothetical protein